MFHKNVEEKINRHFMLSNFFRKAYLLLDNVEKYCTAGKATDDNLIWRMRIACWIPKATDTHSEYAILIIFPLQQCLHESASILRYSYIESFVSFSLSSGTPENPYH
jgi:hypothetical protein